MKKQALIFGLMLSMFFLNTIHAQHKVKKIVSRYMPNLEGYTYDSFAYNEIDFDTAQTKTIEVAFTALAKKKYKIVFGTSGFEQDLQLNIYDKDQRFKKRKKLYDNNEGIDNNYWSFEPNKPGTYYIDYQIPPTKNGSKKDEYVVMLIGISE